MTIVIERIHDLPLASLEALLAESERAGLGLVRRLVDEWVNGTNRFDGRGEGFFVARADGQLVGVCGLNVDPYAADQRVGRVRHLYVLARYRRQGIGRRLVAEVIEAARGGFDTLRLRTANPAAARLYEALGFCSASAAAEAASHRMMLES